MHAFLEHFKTTSDAVTYFPPAMSLPLYTHESPKKAYNCSNEANSIAGKKYFVHDSRPGATCRTLFQTLSNL